MSRNILLVLMLLVLLPFSGKKTYGNATRVDCDDFIQIYVKDKHLDLSATLKTVTKTNLERSVGIANGEIGRFVDLMDPKAAGNFISRLKGVGFYRLGDPAGDINCVIGVDNAKHQIAIVDSKNMNEKKFEICGPWLRRKKGFPWVKLTWECTQLWGYKCSKLNTFGGFGDGSAQFRFPMNMASYIEKNDEGEAGKGPINIWVADYQNERISHMRLNTNGNMEWINSVGNFNHPIDIAFRDDDETPALYIAEETGGQITRIPVVNNDFSFFQNIPGHLQEPGIQINDGVGLKKPTGICVKNGDQDRLLSSATFVYIADAGTEKIYRFMETGATLQYIDCVALPPLGKERNHLGIRNDKYGTLYVFDKKGGKVLIYSPNLEKLSEFGSSGIHSNNTVKFNDPITGFVAEDNLFVVDRWSESSGLQCFNIGGIDIISASVDYVGKTATVTADNSFNRCTYAIDGGTSVVVEGLQYSGNFYLDLTDDLSGLSEGQHTFSVTLESAFSSTKTCTKTVGFIVDPEAGMQPRNIKVSSVGRRIDVTWEAPAVTEGLSGYAVYINDTRVYDCDAETFSCSYYTSRELSGATYNIKLGAIYEQPISFSESGTTNFLVSDGNTLEHKGVDEASANSVQILNQTEWNTFPVGAAWTVNATLGMNPGGMLATPMISIVNAQVGADIQGSEVGPVYLLTSNGCYDSWEYAMEDDRIRLMMIKKGVSEFDYKVFISHSDATVSSWNICNGQTMTFPLSVTFHSNTQGLRLEKCTIGLENTMSSSIPITLRTAGDVTVNGDNLTLDDAVTTAFNDDNLVLSDAQYTLSVPLNVKPAGDAFFTPVRYTIALDPAIALEHAVITYTSSDNLIKTDILRYSTNLQTDINISGVILKSDDPLTVIEGSSTYLTGCDVELTMNDCVIDAPEIQLVTEPDYQHNFPTEAGDQVTIDISSSTLVMNASSGLITLDDASGTDFTGVNLTLSDNLIYQKDDLSCFCFASTGSIDFCGLPNVNVTDNSFLIAEICPGCEDKICSPGQNEIVDIPPGVSYLGSDYGVTNINNPGVTLNGTTGEVEEIRGAIKTVYGMAIGSMTNPKLLSWPAMFIRSNDNTDVDECFYLPINEKSKVNISLDSKGSLYYARDILFTSPDTCEVHNDKYLSKDMFPGDIYYAYGENSFGLKTPKYVLSFPGNVIFDEQELGNFYGASNAGADVFIGATSTDAASGSISWKVESLPIGGNPVNGYETQRSETFFEPLPDVTGFESLSFYYKKKYTDQQFSMVFEDASGITHSIQNTPLPSGTRGWYLSFDAATLDWQQAEILIKDEANIGTDELPLSGKVKKFTIHHQSASAVTAVPTWMLFDNIAFTVMNTVLFNEHNPGDFVGQGGVDGWDGLTSTDAFIGTAGFLIEIKSGNTSSSDEWTGSSTGVELPVSLSKRKLTFAYKKSDPTSYAKIKLHIQNMETNDASVFEISEQSDPVNLPNDGWPIPWQEDTKWHQVFIDLYSVRGTGNIDYPETSFKPFGKLMKIELWLNGAEGAQCLFDNIKFIQDFYRQTVSSEEYSVSADYSEVQATTGWGLNAFGDAGKNAVISYGNNNNLTFQVLKNGTIEPSPNNAIQNMMEIQKSISVSGADFPKTFIYWQEHGAPIGAIELSVGCTDGNNYPLLFSPTSYSCVNARGIINTKSRTNETATKHSYNVENTFEEYYSDLINSSPSVTPVAINGVSLKYQLNTESDWYSKFEYPSITLPMSDAVPLSVTMTQPVDATSYGKIIPVDLSANKEIMSVTISAIANGNFIHRWKNEITTPGQDVFSGSCDLWELKSEQLQDGGALEIVTEVTDVFGEMVSVTKTVNIGWTTPTISLYQPVDQAPYNGIVQLEGSSDILLQTVYYRFFDSDRNPLSEGDFEYTTGTDYFQETITVDDADRYQTLIVQVYGTSFSGMNSPIVERTILLNPRGTGVVVGPGDPPDITWDPNEIVATICGASGATGGTEDNCMFYPAQVFGNFEATLAVTAITPAATTAKAGLMARADLNNNSISDFILMTTSGIFLEYRQTTGQAAVQVTLSSTPPTGTLWFKFKRIGTDLTYYLSTDGMVYNKVYTRTIGTLPVYIGPASTSGNAGTEGCATFTDLSIEKLASGIDQIALGIKTHSRALPSITQDGVLASVEDLSTRYGGQTISINGNSYATGIGGMPQSDGTSSYLIYNLQSEASRLQVERFTRLIGIGSTQDGAMPVAMQIKAANVTTVPDLAEWLTPTDQVYVVWDKPALTNPKNIDIDLTGIKWIGIFISASPMYASRHGVWGDLMLEYIGSEHKAPVITADPQSITRLVGERAVFTVTAEGTLPLRYQWQKNHMNIPGATTSSYMTVPLKLSDDGAVYRCVVTNDFGKEYSFDAVVTMLDVPSGESPEFAIVAADLLDIRNEVTIVGSTILSNALLAIGNDGNITTNVLAAGNISIGDRTEITGNVFAGGSVSLGTGVLVNDGTVAGGQSVSTVEIENHSVTYGGIDIPVNDGETWTATPGDHRDLHAYNYSTLRFGPGVYNFRKFYLESNVAIIFDLDGDEEAVINIYDETRFGDWCDMSIEGTADMFAVTWYSNYAQEVPVHPDSKITGKMIMPYADLHIYSRSIVNGQCLARKVTFEPEAGLNFAQSCPSSNQKPVISVPAAAADNPLTGTSTAMSVLGVDDGGEENLVYHWSVVSVPTGGWVTFSRNNSNEAKNMVATFGATGEYTLQATVEDVFLYRDVSQVTVTVNQELTGIILSPTSASVITSASLQFSAIAHDQFGNNMATQPAFTWSVNGGGTINSGGFFTAGTTPGYFMVTATSGSVDASASIGVTPTAVDQINCGGGVIAPYVADQYFSGGAPRSVTATVSTSGVTNPAPAAVYKTERYGTMTYTIPGLVASSQYIVRLHFAELYWSAPWKRRFNVLINGTTVLANFDIFSAAGGQYKAIARQFIATANSIGRIVINFNTILDNASIGGIEVIPVVPNTAPTITTAAAADPEPVENFTTQLSVLGDDDYGEENLTYTWATTGTPPASVTYSVNGTNDAKTTTATFVKAGNYTFEVTVKDAGNLSMVSSVAVTVNQTLTSIEVSPVSAIVYTAESKQFYATAKDQFRIDLSPQPTISWSVSEGGTISSSGLFTAGSETGGPYTLTVESGEINATASLSVSPAPVLRINSGGSASAPYTADMYYSGGTPRTVTNTIDLTGVTNPAPQSVYKAERYGTMTYTLPGLVASAEYTVRLHFSELYWSATGKRRFNVVINGITELSNYDIFAETGAQYKAVVKEFTATANTMGKIIISFNTVIDNATLEGIDIIRN